MLAIFWGSWILKDCVKVQEKRKKIFCLVFTTKREIRHFHVVVVQRRQRNVQKAWCTWKVIVLSISTYCFFPVLVAVAVAVAVIVGSALYWQHLFLLQNLRVSSIFNSSTTTCKPRFTELPGTANFGWSLTASSSYYSFSLIEDRSH